MDLVSRYHPHPKQAEAHRCPADVVLYAGGYGSGKTASLIHEGISAAERQPGVPILVVSPTYGMLDRVIFRTLVEWLPGAKRWPKGADRAPAALGPLVRDWSATNRVLTWHNGTPWYFGSADNPGSLDGVNVGTVLGDEPRLWTHEAWHVINGRVRAGARQRIFLSGVPAAAWIRDEFGAPMPGRKVVKCSTLDNPHLQPSPEAYVARLRLSPKRARPFIRGDFATYEGAVYGDSYETGATETDPGSVVDDAVDPRRKSWGAVDFGFRRPAFLLLQERDDGTDVVVEEVVGADMAEPEHARRIRDMCARLGVTLLDVYCDPAGGSVNTQTGTPAIRVYEAILKGQTGGPCVLTGRMRASPNPGSPVERHVPNGVEAVRARLLDDQGVRRLFVARHLTQRAYDDKVVGIHDALQGYRYPEGHHGKDEPEKDGITDHCADSLRSFVVGRYGVAAQSLLHIPEKPSAFRQSFRDREIRSVEEEHRT